MAAFDQTNPTRQPAQTRRAAPEQRFSRRAPARRCIKNNQTNPTATRRQRPAVAGTIGVTLVGLTLAFFLAPPAFAQTGGPYDLSWNTIDGGGGPCTGGTFTLTSSIGQHDAGGMAGGSFELSGGFIPGDAPKPQGGVSDGDGNDLDLCTVDRCGLDTLCFDQPVRYADINNDDFVSGDDVNCLLDDIGGDPESLACCDRLIGTCSGPADALPAVGFENKDISPCPSAGDPDNMGDTFLSGDDVNAVLDTIGGAVPGPNVQPECLACAPPMPDPPAHRWDIAVPSVGEAALTLRAAEFIPRGRPSGIQSADRGDEITVIPGGEVTVDVYIDAADDLRTFQVTLDVTGTRDGALTVASVTIDDRRADYVFRYEDTVSTTGVANRVMLATLPVGGVMVTERAYLGTYVLRASPEAAGLFTLNISDDGRTLLRTSQNEVIRVASTPIEIAIASPPTEAQTETESETETDAGTPAR